jgi:hypothetical protein
VSYSLSILRRAQKELAQIPHGDYERIVEAVRVGNRRDVYR